MIELKQVTFFFSFGLRVGARAHRKSGHFGFFYHYSISRKVQIFLNNF